MKKTFLLGAMALFSFSTFAQSTSDKGSGISFGAKAGVAFTTVSGSDVPSGLKSLTSFYVGGTVNVPLGEVFSIQPGLTLVGKGFKTEVLGATLKSNPWYLEVPVNAVAGFQAGPGKIFVGAGPYVGFGLFGENTISGTGTALDGSADIKFGSTSTDDYKMIDFGLNFLAGYQLNNGLSINAGYGMGLSSIGATGSASVKNSVFSVGLGFAF